MSSAICLNQKLNDTEMDIAPQMKKMKLNNSNSSAPESDIIMSNLVSSDPLENLKTAFPSISENMIKEILEKSDNNIEGAKQLISEFKQKQSLNNPNNLNFHQSNRKRRYESAFLNNNSNINNTDSAMNGLTVSSFSNTNLFINKNNNTNSIGSSNPNINVLSNPFGNNNLMGSSVNSAMPERRIIKFNNKIYPINNANISFSNLVAANGNNANNNVNNNLSNNNFNTANNLSNNGLSGGNDSFNFANNPKINLNTNFLENNLNTNSISNANNTEVLNDQSLEELLSEVGQYKTKDDIKAYLKNKITSLINSSNKEISTQAPQINKPIQIEINQHENPIEKVDAEKISLLEKNLHSLESNNKQLKQLICTIYRKYENTQETIQNAKKNFEELDKENKQLKMEKENLEISLMQEKTDHNILKEFIRQFDDSKNFCLPDTRHIY